MNLDDKTVARHALNFFRGVPIITRYLNENESNHIDILKCDNIPYDEVCSYSTLGLHHTNIGVVSNNKSLRVELLGACYESFKEFSNILSTAAFEIMNHKVAFPGDIIENVVSMYYPNSTMKHILLTYPMIWEDTHSLDLSDKIVSWLIAIPISQKEYEYCKLNGLEAIETIFEQQQVDIFDVYRESVM